MRATLWSAKVPVTVAAAAVAIVLAGLLGLLDSPYDMVLVAGIASLLAAILLPLNVLLFMWAALLPIWSIGALPTEIFDLARYGIGALIAARFWARKGPANIVLRNWAVPLAVVAVLVASLAGWHSRDPSAGIIMLASVTLVAAVLWRVGDVWPLLLGFAAGVTASAAVLLGTAAGVGAAQTLVPNESPGFGRFTGLGTAAPIVSVELVVAAIVWWCALRGRRVARLTGLLGMSLTIVALLISGGRTGLLGLGVTVAVLVARRWLNPRVSMLAAIAAAAGAYWVSQREIAFHSLERIRNPGAGGSDITSGRIDRLVDGWDRFVQSPLLGSGSAAHFAPLTFALAGGIVAGVIISILSVRLALMTFSRLRRHASALDQFGALTAAVLTVTVLLETTGPFLGLEMITLLFLTVLATQPREDARTDAGVQAPMSGEPENQIERFRIVER